MGLVVVVPLLSRWRRLRGRDAGNIFCVHYGFVQYSLQWKGERVKEYGISSETETMYDAVLCEIESIF